MSDNASILLVDGDRRAATDVASGLEGRGYRVWTAADASEARQCLEQVTVDLVIVDMDVPPEAGCHLAEWLGDTAQLPFIVTARHNDGEAVEMAAREGALAYLSKPLDAGELAPALRIAQRRGADIVSARLNNRRLEQAVQTNRVISVAVGLMMARSGILRDEAFELLRQKARFQRARVEDLAREVIEAEELLSRTVRQPR